MDPKRPGCALPSSTRWESSHARRYKALHTPSLRQSSVKYLHKYNNSLMTAQSLDRGSWSFDAVRCGSPRPVSWPRCYRGSRRSAVRSGADSVCRTMTVAPTTIVAERLCDGWSLSSITESTGCLERVGKDETYVPDTVRLTWSEISLSRTQSVWPGRGQSVLDTERLTWSGSVCPGHSPSDLVGVSLAWIQSVWPGRVQSVLDTVCLTRPGSVLPGHSPSDLVGVSLTWTQSIWPGRGQ